MSDLWVVLESDDEGDNLIVCFDSREAAERYIRHETAPPYVDGSRMVHWDNEWWIEGHDGLNEYEWTLLHPPIHTMAELDRLDAEGSWL